MKIPFTLEAWLKDKSQRVETRDGRLVHNIWRVKEPSYTNNRETEVCALIDGEEDALVFYEGGRYLPTSQDVYSPFDLFIIASEPELSEFEKACMRLYNEGSDDGLSGDKLSNESLKESASELLELAKKELCEGGEITDWYERGKAVALRTHAIELTKYLANSGLDRDSIPYHLIEFMCNLYTCQNWKEIEEAAEAYVTRLKAAAMKDLPRWKDIRNFAYSWTSEDKTFYNDTLGQLFHKGKKLFIGDLEKLPGFNE